MAQTYSDAVLNAYRQAIAVQQAEWAMQMVAGHIQDLSQYKWLAGQYQGLTEALRLLDEAEKQIQEH